MLATSRIRAKILDLCSSQRAILPGPDALKQKQGQFLNLVGHSHRPQARKSCGWAIFLVSEKWASHFHDFREMLWNKGKKKGRGRRPDASPLSRRLCRCPPSRVPHLPAHVSPALPARKHVGFAPRQWRPPSPSHGWHRGETTERRGGRCNTRSSLKYPDASNTTYIWKQMKHLKYASETLAKTPETIVNIRNIKIKHCTIYVKTYPTSR